MQLHIKTVLCASVVDVTALVSVNIAWSETPPSNLSFELQTEPVVVRELVSLRQSFVSGGNVSDESVAITRCVFALPTRHDIARRITGHDIISPGQMCLLVLLHATYRSQDPAYLTPSLQHIGMSEYIIRESHSRREWFKDVKD